MYTGFGVLGGTKGTSQGNLTIHTESRTIFDAPQEIPENIQQEVSLEELLSRTVQSALDEQDDALLDEPVPFKERLGAWGTKIGAQLLPLLDRRALRGDTQEDAVPEPEMEQTALDMPAEIPWRMVGELYNSYIIVEQGEEAFLIDKHAAHERIIFESLKIRLHQSSKSDSQLLMLPLEFMLASDEVREIDVYRDEIEHLGFQFETEKYTVSECKNQTVKHKKKGRYHGNNFSGQKPDKNIQAFFQAAKN